MAYFKAILFSLMLSVPISGVALEHAAAQHQVPCAKRADVLKHLSAKYSETPIGIGLANNGGVIEVLTSADGATWTIIITLPNGPTCMVSAGENWQRVPVETGEKL